MEEIRIRPKRSSTKILCKAILWEAVAFLLIIHIAGCVYSFRGTSVPSNIKTIAIPIFDDQSGFGEAGLRDKFTNAVIAQFINDNTLQISDRNTADSILEGVITSVRAEPSVVGGGEQVRKWRITITAKLTYTDQKLHRKMWEKSLSNWGDYEYTGGLSARADGIQQAINKLAEDILIETVSGW
jgi:outer membrane lipopolysaccharide assembly protein LptE/RlpB